MPDDDGLVPGARDLDLAEPLAHFAEHGYARLGVVMDEAMRSALGARADDLMLGRVPDPGLFFQRDTETGRYDDLEYGKGYQGPTLNYRKMEKLEKDPLFLAWINNSLFERIAKEWIGDEITIYRALLFNKAKNGGTELPFHQDGGSYWGLDRDPTLQIWTALDDVPKESGCVEIVPGSHVAGLATPLGGVVPEEIVRAKEARARVVPLPARAGEAILIHNYAWHRSGLNKTPAPRRAFTVCYMNAATRCLRKRRAPRTFVRVFPERED